MILPLGRADQFLRWVAAIAWLSRANCPAKASQSEVAVAKFDHRIIPFQAQQLDTWLMSDPLNLAAQHHLGLRRAVGRFNEERAVDLNGRPSFDTVAVDSQVEPLKKNSCLRVPLPDTGGSCHFAPDATFSVLIAKSEFRCGCTRPRGRRRGGLHVNAVRGPEKLACA